MAKKVFVDLRVEGSEKILQALSLCVKATGWMDN